MQSIIFFQFYNRIFIRDFGTFSTCIITSFPEVVWVLISMLFVFICLLNAIIFFLRTVLFAHILKYASGALLLMEVNEVYGQDHFKISLFQALNCKLAVNIILMILCMCRE